MSARPRLHPHLSEEEYLASLTGEKPSLEFVNGEVFAKPLTKRSHLIIADALLEALRLYRRERGGLSGPEPTVDLSRGRDRRYRVPDLAYWAPGKPTGGEVFLPPTLAIEIRSPGQAPDDLRAKCREYRDRGVDVCWLIDPEARTAEVFEAGREGKLLAPGDGLDSPHLPGFSLPLPELFAALD